MDINERLSGIPLAERLLADSEIQAFFPLVSRELATRAVTTALATERERSLCDEAYADDPTVCRAAAIAALEALDRKRQRKVLNGTGAVLNTSLGRAPLPADAWDAARDANVGYTPVGFDLEAGARGIRGSLCGEMAAALAGADAALIVNNNAAGVLLALSTIAKDREVIVARGDQVQIGGGFRVPDVLELAGARAVEVGTANIVDEADYSRAAGSETACALIVHTGDFALRGICSKPSPARVVAAMPESVPVIVDQGSGCTTESIPGEPSVRSFMEAGCALVCFSADKFLGGPQAGVVAGRADLIRRMARNPLYRAFRPGKTVLSLLERVLAQRLNGEPGIAASAMAMPADELKKLARKIKAKLPKGCAVVIDTMAASGGGSGTDEAFESIGLSITPPSTANALQAALRKAPVPLIAIAREGKVVVDMATLSGEDPGVVADTIVWGLERSASLRARVERLTDVGPA
jgi:L-seryl-tRNA(Ser) seleniumtransferase